MAAVPALKKGPVVVASLYKKPKPVLVSAMISPVMFGQTSRGMPSFRKDGAVKGGRGLFTMPELLAVTLELKTQQEPTAVSTLLAPTGFMETLRPFNLPRSVSFLASSFDAGE